MEQRKHNIQVSDKLYNEIKSYCDANQLKVSEYVEKLLRHEFTVDCYGPIPSIFVKDEEVDKTMGDIIENVGGPEAYSKLIDEYNKKKDEGYQNDDYLGKTGITMLIAAIMAMAFSGLSQIIGGGI